MRILIIEDCLKTAAYLAKGFKQHGFIAEEAHHGHEGLFLAQENPYALIILDVMLPGVDGVSVLKALRSKKIETPVIVLTAKGELEDRLQGLDQGADDYLVKPFSFSELLARVRSVLRRQPRIEPTLLQVEDLELHLNKQKVYRNKQLLRLTQKEFQLLTLLMRHQGEVLSRTMIAEQVWDINFDCDTNAIDVAIKRLREKVDVGFDKKLIQTVRGVGYVIEDIAGA